MPAIRLPGSCHADSPIAASTLTSCPDLLGGGELSDAEEQGLFGLRLGPARDVETGLDTPLLEAGPQLMGGDRAADQEFLEPGAALADPIARQGADTPCGVVSLLVAEFGETSEALGTERLDGDREAESQKRLPGGEVRGGALSSDELLARLEREHVARSARATVAGG